MDSRRAPGAYAFELSNKELSCRRTLGSDEYLRNLALRYRSNLQAALQSWISRALSWPPTSRARKALWPEGDLNRAGVIRNWMAGKHWRIPFLVLKESRYFNVSMNSQIGAQGAVVHGFAERDEVFGDLGIAIANLDSALSS